MEGWGEHIFFFISQKLNEPMRLLSLATTLIPYHGVCSLVNYAAEIIQEAEVEEGMARGKGGLRRGGRVQLNPKGCYLFRIPKSSIQVVSFHPPTLLCTSITTERLRNFLRVPELARNGAKPRFQLRCLSFVLLLAFWIWMAWGSWDLRLLPFNIRSSIPLSSIHLINTQVIFRDVALTLHRVVINLIRK